MPYSGRGRPPNPIRVIDPNLKYAQVIKHKKNGRLIEIEKRVIWGTEEEILDMIRDDKRGQAINTSYVESRNRNYRKDNKRLARWSACQSKRVNLHDAQIDFVTSIYNFVDENRSFRQCINPNAKRFEVKYKKYSPAMVEGLTDHCLKIRKSKRHFQVRGGCWPEATLGYRRYRIRNPPQNFEISTDTNAVGC